MVLGDLMEGAYRSAHDLTVQGTWEEPSLATEPPLPFQMTFNATCSCEGWQRLAEASLRDIEIYWLEHIAGEYMRQIAEGERVQE